MRGGAFGATLQRISLGTCHGAAKPILIGAFGFCVFTITTLAGCTFHELLVDFLARLQGKFLRFFGFNRPASARGYDVAGK